MIKAIIFDLGGVCFEIDWLKINDEMVKKFNITTLVKSAGNEKAITYYKEALEGKRHPIDMFRELNNRDNDLNDIIKFYKEMYKKYKTHNKQIYELIKNLKNKFTIVCLSDTNVVHYQAHEEQGTIKDFHHVFTSFKIGSIKRDKNTFKKVLNELSIKPEETVFIDDNDKNVEIAKSLGINGIKYTNYEDLIKELENLKVL
ncbi:MAG TPA: HAD family phosphatase [Candidatus Nanoarchaeia archaeon]|nr:HAD family phosphatase [Candidatus Woesearchaeota archaeon]HLD11191.1 HAD family phosphatase [Candidatus Nanoarchaeia archaeon]